MIEKFKEVLMNYVETEEIKDTDDFRNDLGLASFDTVCLVTELKKEFGTECTPSDFVRNRNVSDFYNNVLCNKN